MKERLTAKFDSLQLAEEAATKLRSIRLGEVEISDWNGQPSNDTEFAAEYVGGYMGNLGQYYPGMGGGVSSSMFAPISFAANELLHQAGTDRRSYLLNAAVSPDQREKALRIIRDSGGNEV